MRLVAYLRISSESQSDGYGLDIQEKAVRKWAKANSHRLVRVYRDVGLSGALGAADRPELSSALADIEGMVAEGLLIPRLDRLARAVTVQEAVLALIWRTGGSVFAADQGEVLRDDPDDPMRTAMREMAGVFAGLERRMIAKRMRDGRKAKAAAGKHAAGQYPFGFRGEGKGRERDATPDPEEQSVVARIIELRETPMSYREVAAALTGAGTPTRLGKEWSAMSVRRTYIRAVGGIYAADERKVSPSSS